MGLVKTKPVYEFYGMGILGCSYRKRKMVSSYFRFRMGGLKMKKLKLTYVRLPVGTFGCIPENHYDLHTDEKEPTNIACILTDKEGAKLIRKWINIENDRSI